MSKETVVTSQGLRAEAPVPIHRAALKGARWLRDPRPGAATTPTTVDDGPAETASADAVESARDALVGLDEAIAALETMRTRFLAVLGTRAIQHAMEQRLDPRIAIRAVASELARRERRNDHEVEAEVWRATASTARPSYRGDAEELTITE